MPSQPRRTSHGTVYLVLGGLVVACLVIGGGVWAQNNTAWFKRVRGGNAWDLTYQAGAVGGGGGGQAATVRYRFNPDSFERAHRIEQVGRAPLPWSKQALVNTGELARVEVEPEGDAIATCRILLDGVRVVAEGRSPSPGRPAACQVTTSSTPEKWPH
ncbi:hypothetical protein ACFVFQ_01305 [Streptomyces sp. NPDC057743]|uniref:hypothetical protein n=1 Tax=Streptomyces sp. NPDC057743 TaxID=3346236 RepID=UPI0036C7FD1E